MEEKPRCVWWYPEHTAELLFTPMFDRIYNARSDKLQPLKADQARGLGFLAHYLEALGWCS